MSLPKLPPLRPAPPKCAGCGKGSTRFVDTQAGRFTLCDTCEPPDVIASEPMVRLPPLSLPPGVAGMVGELPPIEVPKRIADAAMATLTARGKLPPLTGPALRKSPDLPPLATAFVKGYTGASKLPPLGSLASPSAAQPQPDGVHPSPAGFARAAAVALRKGEGVPYVEQGRQLIANVAARALYEGCPPARIIATDNPWMFGDATPHKGAEDHYKCLTIPQLCAFPLPPIADDAILFMWRVAGGNEKDGSLGEQAYTVARAWGFTPKSEMVWIKTLECKVCTGRGWGPLQHVPEAMQAAFAEVRVWCDSCHGRGYKIARGMGRYVRGSHEVCLIATRGKPQFPEDKSVSSVFNAHRLSHSEKPLRFFEKVQQLYPQGPYVELFARRRRPGWHCFGDQLPPE